MKRQFAVASLLFVLACQDSSTGPHNYPLRGPNAAIIDGAHGGNPHFFWLSPQSNLSPFGRFAGTANRNMAPVVKLCRWNGSSCVGGDVAVLTRSAGIRDRIYYYEATWQAFQADPQLNELFRARVFLGNLEIGARDLKFVTKDEALATSNANFDFAPVVWDAARYPGGGKGFGTYVLNFRLEDGVLREALGLDDDECTDCAEGSVPANATETVVIETPNDDAAAVFEPGSVPQDINVLVEKLDVPCLPTDAQQYPACYRFVAEPDVEFTIPATVEVCIEEIDDFAEDQVQLYKVKERRVEGEWVPTGPVEALENVADRFINCGEPEVIGAIGRKYPQLARGLRALSRPLAKVLGPRVAWATDEGRGGRTSEFSRVGWARAVDIEKASGDNQNALIGTALSPAVVRLTPEHFDDHGEGTPNAAGVPVRHQLLGPSTAGPIIAANSNVDGLVSIPVTLGSAPGTYRLVVTAPGTNLADRNPETNELEPRPVPEAEFTFTAFQTGVSIIPTSLGVGNCFPFGGNTGYGGFMGFIYRNIPPFIMRAGDKIAFDLGALNNEQARRNIFFAIANKNPGPAIHSGGNLTASQDVRAVSWVQVVSDAQVPLNPQGNTIRDDFELVYTAETDFTFTGGGFVIGFANAANGSYTDPGCEQVLVFTTPADPSGQFYARFLHLPYQTLGTLDPPFGIGNGTWIGGVKITTSAGPSGPVLLRIGTASTTAAKTAPAKSRFVPDDHSANADGTPATRSARTMAGPQKRGVERRR